MVFDSFLFSLLLPLGFLFPKPRLGPVKSWVENFKPELGMIFFFFFLLRHSLSFQMTLESHAELLPAQTRSAVPSLPLAPSALIPLLFAPAVIIARGPASFFLFSGKSRPFEEKTKHLTTFPRGLRWSGTASSGLTCLEVQRAAGSQAFSARRPRGSVTEPLPGQPCLLLTAARLGLRRK